MPGRESGISLLELLVASALLAILLVLIYSQFFLGQRICEVHSEIAAMQAQPRFVVDWVNKDALLAGYGLRFGGMRLDAVHPGDPGDPGVYSDDHIAFRFNDADIWTRLREDMPQPSSELKVEGTQGFQEGDRVVIFDETGSVDWLIITHVQTSAKHLQHRPPINPDDLSKAYKVADGAIIARVSEVLYYHDPDTLRVFRQVDARERRAIAHNISDLIFLYYDDSIPAQLFTPDTPALRARIRKVEMEVLARTEHEQPDTHEHRTYRLITEIVPRNVVLEGTNPHQ